MKRVGNACLFDNRRDPEAYDIDAARDAEIGGPQEPDSPRGEGVTQLRQSLLLLLLARDDPSHHPLLASIKPFGAFNAVVEIEQDRDAKEDATESPRSETAIASR